MPIRSLGYRTDLIFPRFDGIVEDRGEYTVITTPSNPSFHWGNFLIFNEAPRAGDRERWTGIFRHEFASHPEVDHLAFGWDDSTDSRGDLDQFEKAGFQLSLSEVLSADRVNPPPRWNEGVETRVLRSEDEWQAALESQIACREPGHTLEDYTVFMTEQFRRYQAMEKAGLGHWYGGYVEGKLAGSLGIFRDSELGRFQTVGTTPEFRGQGVCGALVYAAAQDAFQRLGMQKLVMVADESGAARRIYESVGFRSVEKQSGVSWWKRA